MNDTVPPVEQCDVCNKASLASYRTKKAKWWRWLRTANQNALWPQIYAMIIEDMTFRTLVAAADADKESGLHSPIIRRGILQGNAATQGLAIRRLTDKKNISLRRLLRDIKENIRLITRENYVSGEGLPYDYSDADANWSAHLKFDRLAGKQAKSRSRDDKIPKRVIKILEGWLDAKEIGAVVDWTNEHIAHAADPENARTDVTPLTMDNIAASQRKIVRTAEAVSAYLLNGTIHGAIIPIRYNQFSRFEMIVNREAVKKAQERWRELAEERDQWTQGIWKELLAMP